MDANKTKAPILKKRNMHIFLSHYDIISYILVSTSLSPLLVDAFGELIYQYVKYFDYSRQASLFCLSNDAKQDHFSQRKRSTQRYVRSFLDLILDNNELVLHAYQNYVKDGTELTLSN